MPGTAYKYTPHLTLRGSVSISNNPVPEGSTNPPFTGIVKHHLTGAGDVNISHRQINTQISYSMFF